MVNFDADADARGSRGSGYMPGLQLNIASLVRVSCVTAASVPILELTVDVNCGIPGGVFPTLYGIM